MNTKKYEFAKLIKMDLNSMYDGNINTLKALDDNLLSIINTEAPITMNLVKARLREAFQIGKISQKALDIINEHILKLGFKETDNFYDKVLWPSSGVFEINYLRDGYERQIYDVCYQEMKNLCDTLNLRGEELYREILKYFGFEVLTKKALDYLTFIEKKCK